MGIITGDQWNLVQDKRWKSSALELPEKEGKYYCIVPDDRAILICDFKNGFFEQRQNFQYKAIITRYRVHYWITEEDYTNQKNNR